MKRSIQLEILVSILAVFSVVGLLTFQNHTARMEQWETFQSAQSIQHGAALYEANCKSCHGVNGEGVGDLGPALNDEFFFTERMNEVYWTGTLEEYVQNSISAGRVVPTRAYYTSDGQVAMVAWSQEFGGPLRPDELRDLTAFVLNWEATALGEVQLTPLQITAEASTSGDPAQGQQVFMENGCASCHSIEAINPIQSTAPDLTHVASATVSRQPSLSAEGYLRESFLIPNAFIVEGYAENSGCGGLLSYDQLNHLTAFLLTLE